MFQLFLFAVLAFSGTVVAQCNRTLLQDATAQYVAAQRTGPGSNLTFISSNVTYSENEQSMNIAKGVLAQALNVDEYRSIHDTTACSTFTQLIVTSATHPYVIGTRMVLTGRQVTKIESVVTDTGDWLFNATGYLYWDSQERWSVIAANKRDSRETLKAAGDAYFDRFHDVSVAVPWGTPCARLEGGAYTGSGNLSDNTCNLGVPSNITVTNRRYVIDEKFGAVNIFLGFPGLDQTQGDIPMPDSHTFRIEKGKIRYIHTLSSCVTAGCGFNGTGLPTKRRGLIRSRKAKLHC